MGILTGLTPSAIAKLTNSTLVALGTTDIAGLTATQLPGLTSVEMATFSSKQIAAFTTTQLLALTTSQIASISASGVAGLTTGGILALGTTSIAALTSSQIGALSSAQIGAITTNQFGVLTTSQIAAFSSSSIAGLTTTNIAALKTTQLLALTSAEIKSLNTTQIAALTTTAVKSLTSTQIAGLTSTEMAALSSSQIGALTTAQIPFLNASQIAAISTAGISALTTSSIVALGTAGVAALTSSEVAALSSTQISAMTSVQISVLLASNVASMKATQFGGVRFNYGTMLSILQQDAVGGMTAKKFAALKSLASSFNVTGGISTSGYIQYISNALVNGNAANATWTGGQTTSSSLGNLTASSSQAQVNQLIGKWFLGTDLPSSSVNIGNGPFRVTYSTSSASLFASSGPSMTDVNQGRLGDCFLESVLAATACQNPTAITSMITSNGNNTYGVRFYVGGQATYVTVNNSLANGGTAFNNSNNIWASVIETAYAELQSAGDVTGNNSGTANSFSLIGRGGYAECALAEVLGAVTVIDYQSFGSFWMSTTYDSTSLSQPNNTAWKAVGDQPTVSLQDLQNILISDLNNKCEIILGSNTDAKDSSQKNTLLSNHDLAIYGFDTKTQNFQIYNPWGTVKSGQYWETTFEISLSTLMTVHDQSYNYDTISVVINASSSSNSAAKSAKASAMNTASTLHAQAASFASASACLSSLNSSSTIAFHQQEPQATTMLAAGYN